MNDIWVLNSLVSYNKKTYYVTIETPLEAQYTLHLYLLNINNDSHRYGLNRVDRQ